jgi:uncharacterized ferritin-like protein (DUF455 family)
MNPAPRTAQEFARRYLHTTDLLEKCSPGAIPDVWEDGVKPEDLRPLRPPELRVTEGKPRTFKRGALARPEMRAALHHKFWHHELQAAELFCWALLRFPNTPRAFQKGLLRIFSDEVRHMELYQRHLESLGHALGDFEVRDWFWERVPTCETPVQFVALLGMGLEGANLEHTERFASWFRSIPDERAAQIQDQVGCEEIAHVRFAIYWFTQWTGNVDFTTWCRELPPPLSPLLLRGKHIHRERRAQACFPVSFIDELQAWRSTDNVTTSVRTDDASSGNLL